jgi:hypothetical protein
MYPEDGNWNVCRKLGQLSRFDASHTRVPKLTHMKHSLSAVTAILSRVLSSKKFISIVTHFTFC